MDELDEFYYQKMELEKQHQQQAKELFKKTLRIAMKDIDKKAESEERGFDREGWHEDADDLLIKVLRCEGYDELCDWWESCYKWYA